MKKPPGKFDTLWESGQPLPQVAAASENSRKRRRLAVIGAMVLLLLLPLGIWLGVRINRDLSRQVRGLVLSQNQLELFCTHQVQLTCAVYPATAEAQVTWSTSDARVATVDSDGRVVAVGVGECTIIARADREQAIAAVRVTQPPIESLEISAVEDMIPGEQKKLSCRILPGEYSNFAVAWRSSNPELAAVDAHGNVTALAVGTCRIYATLFGLETYVEFSIHPESLSAKERKILGAWQGLWLKQKEEPVTELPKAAVSLVFRGDRTGMLTAQGYQNLQFSWKYQESDDSCGIYLLTLEDGAQCLCTFSGIYLTLTAGDRTIYFIQ